ncbi:hypothetical protein DPSP01_003831 [Paraphaeosphaeria sporulosa]
MRDFPACDRPRPAGRGDMDRRRYCQEMDLDLVGEWGQSGLGSCCDPRFWRRELKTAFQENQSVAARRQRLQFAKYTSLRVREVDAVLCRASHCSSLPILLQQSQIPQEQAAPSGVPCVISGARSTPGVINRNSRHQSPAQPEIRFPRLRELLDGAS